MLFATVVSFVSGCSGVQESFTESCKLFIPVVTVEFIIIENHNHETEKTFITSFRMQYPSP